MFAHPSQIDARSICQGELVQGPVVFMRVYFLKKLLYPLGLLWYGVPRSLKADPTPLCYILLLLCLWYRSASYVQTKVAAQGATRRSSSNQVLLPVLIRLKRLCRVHLEEKFLKLAPAFLGLVKIPKIRMLSEIA